MTRGNYMDNFDHRADSGVPIQDGRANNIAPRGQARKRRREPFAWLGLGALGLGVGAALAAGSGVAYADTAESGTASSQSESPGRPSSGAVTPASRRRPMGFRKPAVPQQGPKRFGR